VVRQPKTMNTTLNRHHVQQALIAVPTLRTYNTASIECVDRKRTWPPVLSRMLANGHFYRKSIGLHE
jgi:hypothetical protein